MNELIGFFEKKVSQSRYLEASSIADFLKESEPNNQIPWDSIAEFLRTYHWQILSFSQDLSWINKLRPVTYKWDQRAWYGTDEDPFGIPDGSKKASKINIGLLAQEELEIEKEHGFGNNENDMLIADISTDGNQYSMKYERLVPVLVNAVKELSAENTALKARLDAAGL